MATSLTEHVTEIEKLYFEKRWTYQQIADKYGKSREAVRQFLNRHFPDRAPGHLFREESNREQHTKALAEEIAWAEKHGPRCVVCNEPILRRTGGAGENRTCSPEHSALWTKARFWLDEDLRRKQRLSMAQSILRHPQGKHPSAKDWARRVIETKGRLTASEREPRPDSQAYQAYLEVLRIRGLTKP